MTNHNDYNIYWTINKNFLNIILLSVAIVIILLLPYVKEILLPVSIAIFLALLLDPLINRLEGKGIGRVIAILIVLVFMCGIVVFMIIHLTPLIDHEIESITKLIRPSIFMITLERVLPFLHDTKTMEYFVIHSYSIVEFLLRKSANIFPVDISGFLLLFIIPIITFLLLKDGYYVKKSIIQTLPNRYFEMILNLTNKLNRKISEWLRDQLLIAAIIGIFSIIALYLLNISNYLIIGILVGLANLIPIYGTIIGATIAITITLLETDSLSSVLGVIIAFSTIKLIYNLVLSPTITSNVIHLNPLIAILILLIGSYLWGLTGMLLIIPITSIMILIGKEVYWSFKHYRLF